ncbi:MAG: hypothetical protein QOA28_03810, partial [Nitrososphaeraceae archaeon]|nr:hypothetical protein [Nitrososphaeraceae archaeon]
MVSKIESPANFTIMYRSEYFTFSDYDYDIHRFQVSSPNSSDIFYLPKTYRNGPEVCEPFLKQNF